MVNLTTISKMCESINYNQILRTVFGKCVESVKPKSLLNSQRIGLVSPDTIRVGDECIDIKNRKCHLVGFGKAVLGMAVQIERTFGETLASGILSVPFGTANRFAADQDMQLRKESVIKVFEGAKDNMPDENALATARRIFEYAERMTDQDVLFVLISGGGSALLPIPADPIKLDEKIQVIRKLAHSGATINELNTVRIKMSSSKGGKLALAARNAHKIVSLIISDICGDPINLIASGPTLIRYIPKDRAEQILRKYNLMDTLPESVLKCLSTSAHSDAGDLTEKSLVQVVGNNRVAIDVAKEELSKSEIRGICMSKRLEGDVSVIAFLYCKIAEAVYELNSGELDGELNVERFHYLLDSLKDTLKYEDGFTTELRNAVLDKTNRSAICIISGGEPTVTVKGNGIGGRNQELALRMAIEIENSPMLRDVAFLSAGTDGIDGPTDAAGAIASLQVANDCREMENGGAETYLKNNDSYNLFKKLCDGKYHIKTGHTGTNVMDLHFLMIPLNCKE